MPLKRHRWFESIRLRRNLGKSMQNLKEKIKQFTTSRENVRSLIIFTTIVIVVFLGGNFFRPYFSGASLVVLWISLVLIILVTWIMAGHVVMKSLFWVGASLSLIIFLAQSYCAIPVSGQNADDALKTLLVSGMGYIIIDFFRNLYKEVTAQIKMLKQTNQEKNPWVILIPFGLFIGIFLWQIWRVMLPILQSLCIYK